MITATTKSGSNVWTGNVLVGYQNKGMVSLDTFQRVDKKTTQTSPSPTTIARSRR